MLTPDHETEMGDEEKQLDRKYYLKQDYEYFRKEYADDAEEESPVALEQLVADY